MPTERTQLTREQIEAIRTWLHDQTVNGTVSMKLPEEFDTLCDMALSRTPSQPLRQVRRIIAAVGERLDFPDVDGAAPSIKLLSSEAVALLTAASLSLAPEPTGEVGEMVKRLRVPMYELRLGENLDHQRADAANMLEGLSAAREAVLAVLDRIESQALCVDMDGADGNVKMLIHIHNMASEELNKWRQSAAGSGENG